jgi:hypothetical protein
MRLQFSLRKCLSFLVAAAFVFLGVGFYLRLENQFRDGYLVASTSGLLKDFVEEKAKWPRDWNELEYFVKEGDSITLEQFNSIRDRVVIVFDLDLRDLALNFPPRKSHESTERRILYARFGTWFRPFGDTNADIREYLHDRSENELEFLSEGQTLATKGGEVTGFIQGGNFILQADTTNLIKLPHEDVVRFRIFPWRNRTGFGIVLECSKPSSRFFSYRWANVYMGGVDDQRLIIEAQGSIIENTDRLELAPASFQMNRLFIALKDTVDIPNSKRHLVFFFSYDGTAVGPDQQRLSRYYMIPGEILNLKQSAPWSVQE